MIAWLDTLDALLGAGQDCILVSVVAKTGSAPRGADAKMVVSADSLSGTIGGGALEFNAIARARELLKSGSVGGLETALLGPDLGQCCGGAVSLAFERFGLCERDHLQALRARLDAGGEVTRRVRFAPDGAVSRNIQANREDAPLNPFKTNEFIDVISDHPAAVWLFGAGHVGRAVITALSPLPFALTWIDRRDGIFPEDAPRGVTTIGSGEIAQIVGRAPACASYIVMTHCHRLDEDICAAVLARGDAAYLGLIGSKTKRARFEHRLAARGVSRARLRDMHCPIGIPGLTSKTPEAIAASVAADLLLRMEAARDSLTKQTKKDGDEQGKPLAHAQGG